MKARSQWWKNKVSGKEVFVSPWWEIPDEQIIIDFQQNECVDMEPATKFAPVTALVQVGWLIRNEHDVFFGVHTDTQDQFDFVRYPEPKVKESERTDA